MDKKIAPVVRAFGPLVHSTLSSIQQLNGSGTRVHNDPFLVGLISCFASAYVAPINPNTQINE